MSPASLCSWPCLLRLWAKIREESLQNDSRPTPPCRKGVRRRWKKKSAVSGRDARAEERTALWDVSGKSSARVANHCQRCSRCFTGGASLALAAVGLAVMVADEIVKAATGVSFIQQALNPIMVTCAEAVNGADWQGDYQKRWKD